jgi:hypothetical protein
VGRRSSNTARRLRSSRRMDSRRPVMGNLRPAPLADTGSHRLVHPMALHPPPMAHLRAALRTALLLPPDIRELPVAIRSPALSPSSLRSNSSKVAAWASALVAWAPTGCLAST